MSSEPAPSVCAFCRKPFAPEDDRLVQYSDGAPVAAYHEWCRPDRRRSGCGGAACGR